jgi:hypothetical protein
MRRVMPEDEARAEVDRSVGLALHEATSAWGVSVDFIF